MISRDLVKALSNKLNGRLWISGSQIGFPIMGYTHASSIRNPFNITRRMIMCLLYCIVVFSIHILPVLILISTLMGWAYKSKAFGIKIFIVSLLSCFVTMVVKLCFLLK